MRFILPAALLASLLLTACEIEPPAPYDDGREASLPPSNVIGFGTTPVRIGESGPAFDACAIRAVVTDPGGTSVPLRAAPFDAGDELQRVGNGTRLYVCTRSLDQRWLGVVVIPGGEGPDSCGLQARIDQPRGYAGPCASGWVPRALVRLTGA